MTVHLVGAGPGDPDLLTLRAAELLRSADCVVHDRLVDARILDLIAPWVETIDVGKRGGRPSWKQADITSLLADRAVQRRCGVRLKGGDPFVFGRGGEEALAIRAAGIEVEVVPGVTAAVAAPAAAGIPVTHRGLASGVSVVTAHQDPESDPLDWAALARSGTTLVILMGARRAAHIAARLLAGGLPGTTPVAVITNATRSDQRIDRLELRLLGQDSVEAPATIVVGPTAALDVTGLVPTSLEVAA